VSRYNNNRVVTTIRRDTKTKNLRKTILKFLKDIPVVEDRHRGVFSITGYRVYDYNPTGYYVEIDVVFKGELKVSISSLRPDEWFGADVKKNERYSIQPNRLGKFLRKQLFNEINNRMKYFSTELTYLNSIKTIKWI
jgi:hypothetical protein